MMDVTFGDSNNVEVSFTLTTQNISTINTQLQSIFNTLKTFDNSQITSMQTQLNTSYSILRNMTYFLEQWEDVETEVEL